MSTTHDYQRQIDDYNDAMLLAFADFSVVRMSFCRFVNFFESTEVAERWAAKQGGRRFRILPVEVAFVWAKDYVRSIFTNYPAPGAP